MQINAAGNLMPTGWPENQYIKICHTLAMDLSRLCAYRERINQQLLSSPLGDDMFSPQTLECAYLDMWQEVVDGRRF